MIIKNIEEFPGNANAVRFLENIIIKYKIKSVADVGGGANPMLPLKIVKKYSLDYYVFDIDESELQKAPKWCNCLKVDIASPDKNFVPAEMLNKFDLVFSHFLLEHVKGVKQAHLNIAKLLRHGGIAVHFFPSINNLPIFINMIIPEWISRKLVKIFQPTRDKVYQVKFPAYYELCTVRTNKMKRVLRSLGYSVEEHVGYIGHSYYERFELARWLELLGRKIFVFLKIPFTSTIHIVLKKLD